MEENMYKFITEDKPKSYADFFLETKRDKRPYSGELPVDFSARQPNYDARRIDVAQMTSTKGDFVCFNERVSASPFYLRSWAIFEDMPMVPSIGDVTKDPRYSMITKQFSE